MLIFNGKACMEFRCLVDCQSLFQGTYREFGDCLCHKFVEMMSDNKDWEEDPDAGQSAQVNCSVERSTVVSKGQL